ncbi:MAG: hypothetical protein ABJF23_09300 [Bryobacteraceae bacterium]
MLTVTVVLSAALQIGVASGQVDTDPKAVEIPQTLRTTLRSHPAIKECLEYEHLPLEKILSVSRFEPIQPRYQTVLAEGLLPCLSGNVNHLILLYVLIGKDWHKVLDETGAKLERLPSATRGWRHLTLWQHSSAFESLNLSYQFDGTEYKPVSCKEVEFADPSTGNPHPKPKSVPCTWDWKPRRK